MKNPGRVLSRRHLMDVTHGTGWHAYERTIDAQISRLRKKIEIDPKRPTLIKSVHGDGYVFTASVSKFVALEYIWIGTEAQQRACGVLLAHEDGDVKRRAAVAVMRIDGRAARTRRSISPASPRAAAACRPR